MSALTIRNLESETVAKLRVRAAEGGRSMEAEARYWLKAIADNRVRIVDQPKLTTDRAVIDARVERARARVRAALGGELPKGLVDELIAERREAAARGD